MLALIYPIEVSPPPNKEVQVECPSCGAQRAFSHLALYDPQTDQFITNRFGPSMSTTTALVLACAAVSLWLFTTLFGQDWTVTSIIIGMALALAVIIFLSYRSAQRESRAQRIHRYECLYCHHRWDWKEGSPMPHYNRRQQTRQDFQEVFGHSLDE